MSFSKVWAFCALAFASIAAQAQSTVPADPLGVSSPIGPSHLTLGEVDNLARAAIVRSFGADAPAPAAPVASSQPIKVTKPEPVVPDTPRAVFVGAYKDTGSRASYVLYEINDGVTTARVGTTLPNGWHVDAQEGYFVSLTYRGRHWQEPIQSMPRTQQEPVALGAPIPALSDVLNPLPPAMRRGGVGTGTVN